jgi:hypothetical protein
MATPSGYTNPNAKGNKSAAKPKAKMDPKAVEKSARAVSATSKPTGSKPTVKVPQSTIDYIKKIGMTQALKEIKKYGQQARMVPGNKQYETMRQGGRDLLGAEFATGVKRLYGEKRFANAAGGSTAPKKASTSYSPAPYKKPKPKSGGGSSSKVK